MLTKRVCFVTFLCLAETLWAKKLYQGIRYRIPTSPHPLENHTTLIRHVEYDKPFVFLTHGKILDNTYLNEMAMSFIHAYPRSKYNLIFLDWSEELKDSKNLYKLVLRVGNLLREGIELIRESAPAGNTLKITLIGHNLGIIVVGKAGNELHKNKVSKIIGLDPPLQNKRVHKPNKLNRNSAEIVEVFHTSDENFGDLSASGHRDFYWNRANSSKNPCTDSNTRTCASKLSYQIYTSAKLPGRLNPMATLCFSLDRYMRGKCSGNPTLHIQNDLPIEKDSPSGKYYFDIN